MKENVKESAWRGAQQAKDATESVAEKAKGATKESGSYIGGAREPCDPCASRAARVA